MTGFRFDNSYARDLEGLYVRWRSAPVPEPVLLQLNEALASELGLADALQDRVLAARRLAAIDPPDGADPLAMVYAGHQFGGYSPRLGDGRALLLGEILDPAGQRHDIHLKGSGRTPYARGGDGKAVLGPVLREYIIGEAMHGLGIPTTRALAVITTGEDVARERFEPGAILVRVASSHLRVGSVQYAAASGDAGLLRRLVDHAIRRHDPDLAGRDDRYLAFLDRVCMRQADLVARWMLVGFVHGVMNTDNTTLSGETIDYGPCAFLDAFDRRAVFSSIDQGGRYAYGNQPAIAQWNLSRLAEGLLPLIDPEDPGRAIEPATRCLDAFAERYHGAFLDGMRRKLGLEKADDDDLDLVNALFRCIDARGLDFTGFFRNLPAALAGDHPLVDVRHESLAPVRAWLDRWRLRFVAEPTPADARFAAMSRVNPLYIARNHKVEEALAAARDGDLVPFGRLVALVSRPFDPVAGAEDHEGPAPPEFGRYRTFCGT